MTPVYLEDGYVSPVEPTSSLIHGPSTPRTMQPIQPRNAGHSPQRQYQMNSPMVRASESVSDLVYGFRPKAGWPGVLFQVILQGAFLDDSLKYAQLAFWISFGGNEVPAIRHETEAHYVLPDLGKKRSVLQCIVPEDQYFNNITAVSMTVYGVGRKARVKDAFIGFFQLIPNGNNSRQMKELTCRWIDANVLISKEWEYSNKVVERDHPPGYRHSVQSYSERTYPTPWMQQ